MITNERKAELIKQFGANEKDTGSASVQVAILTERIKNLTGHFGKHKHDYHGKRGLMKLIGQRRRLLRYISASGPEKYQSLIKELGLRK
jgi:small subunit ribosomal protein S15